MISGLATGDRTKNEKQYYFGMLFTDLELRQMLGSGNWPGRSLEDQYARCNAISGPSPRGSHDENLTALYSGIPDLPCVAEAWLATRRCEARQRSAQHNTIIHRPPPGHRVHNRSSKLEDGMDNAPASRPHSTCEEQPHERKAVEQHADGNADDKETRTATGTKTTQKRGKLTG